MEHLYFSAVRAVLLSLFLAASSQNAANQSSVIRIATGNYGSFVQVKKYDENGHPLELNGIGVEYLKWLTAKYNLKPEIMKFYSATNESDVYSLMVLSSNGTWMGALGDLVNNVSDLALAIANARPEYLPHFMVTYPLFESSFSMFTPYPDSYSQASALLKPFSVWTWILLLISLLFTPFCMYLLSKVQMRNQTTGEVTYYFFLYHFFTVITGQDGPPLLRKLRNGVIVAMSWYLAAVVLVNGYQGLLVSNLTLQVPRPIVNSYSELIKKPEVKFFTFSNSKAHYELLTAAFGNMKLLGDILREDPDRIEQTYLKCLEQVERGGHVCFAPTAVGDAFAERRLRETGSCTMTRVGDPLMTSDPVMLLRKDHVFSSQISEAIIQARSFGLDRKWVSEYQGSHRYCKIENLQTKAKSARFTMKHMSSAFVLLGIGIGASLICFVLEHVVFALNRKKIHSRRPKPKSSSSIRMVQGTADEQR